MILLALVSVACLISVLVALLVALFVAARLRLHRLEVANRRLREENRALRVEQAWFARAPKVWGVIEDWMHESERDGDD